MSSKHAEYTSRPRQETSSITDERLLAHKATLHRKLIQSMDLTTLSQMSEQEVRSEVCRVARSLCLSSTDLLSLQQRERLIDEVVDETLGLGPLEPLMRDPSVSDILINGPRTVYVERNGRLERANVVFNDDRHVVQIVQRIVSRVGRRVDETTPMVDARLPGGSRINATIAPVALDGTLVSIRQFGTHPMTMDELVARGALTADMVRFLSACIVARLNVMISGGTGSGKTTLLNALSASIPATERVATIEDAAELRLQQPHVVRMETRPANIEGTGEITTRDLVRNALRMRPDRIIVGECRGPEALDMLQAMNTGHEGSLTTIHANDTADAISRLEMMVGMAVFNLPLWIIHRQIAKAIHVIVQTARLVGGARKVVKISEVTGTESETITMHDLFEFKQTGVDAERNAVGYFRATGIRPRCLERLDVAGATVPIEMFERRN
jgi:pilus assembly protein CpaF